MAGDPSQDIFYHECLARGDFLPDETSVGRDLTADALRGYCNTLIECGVLQANGEDLPRLNLDQVQLTRMFPDLTRSGRAVDRYLRPIFKATRLSAWDYMEEVAAVIVLRYPPECPQVAALVEATQLHDLLGPIDQEDAVAFAHTLLTICTMHEMRRAGNMQGGAQFFIVDGQRANEASEEREVNEVN